ncbi:MAG: hypothetical protein KKC75_08245 [Nanoarchaeota archaeon]|nr:hypothetical protein [Nanoarchaeota archaeon]MBU1005063.1 hypothetical protein [Nanoarchaeota archaeon]MBU1946275.1 hypothetical protein [Nanoarchaeota archaeon]
MLEDKKLKESSAIIKKIITEGGIIKPTMGSIEFFMEKSRQSIAVASRLMELESEEGLTADMWIINASYYSMFFAAISLLAKSGRAIKKEVGIHKLTYHALIHYFLIEDNKLEKYFIEGYKEAVQEAEELLQLSERKTEEFIRAFDNETSKRKMFTYDLGKTAEKIKAETSLLRAKKFVNEVEKIIS